MKYRNLYIPYADAVVDGTMQAVHLHCFLDYSKSIEESTLAQWIETRPLKEIIIQLLEDIFENTGVLITTRIPVEVQGELSSTAMVFEIADVFKNGNYEYVLKSEGGVCEALKNALGMIRKAKEEHGGLPVASDRFIDLRFALISELTEKA